MIIARHHAAQHYSILFNTASGFFARIEDPGWPEPLWSKSGPELIDIAVTNWCDRDCPFCYRRSNTSGTHMTLADYQAVIRQAAHLGVLQVALGGGNPNQHPDFLRILELTRREFGIVPSYTTNGRGLTTGVLSASRQFCGAVAVSAYPPYQETADAVKKLLSLDIKTNVHFILDSASVSKAITWLRDPPDWLKGINALIFLNFKPVTRNGDQASLAANHPQAADLFALATSADGPFKVGFDDCCTTGLLAYGDPHPAMVGACESARFTMFISEQMRAYPCSFMTSLCDGDLVESNNLLDIWQRGEQFVAMRQSLVPGKCTDCRLSESCLGGCPLFPEIDFCRSTRDTKLVQVGGLRNLPLPRLELQSHKNGHGLQERERDSNL